MATHLRSGHTADVPTQGIGDWLGSWQSGGSSIDCVDQRLERNGRPKREGCVGQVEKVE